MATMFNGKDYEGYRSTYERLAGKGEWENDEWWYDNDFVENEVDGLIDELTSELFSDGTLEANLQNQQGTIDFYPDGGGHIGWDRQGELDDIGCFADGADSFEEFLSDVYTMYEQLHDRAYEDDDEDYYDGEGREDDDDTTD